MCSSCARHRESNRAGQGVVGYRNIPLDAKYFAADKSTAVTYTVSEAVLLMRSGQVTENHPLFAILIDIVANAGEVG